ncbi:unnamed protein product (macronuclear) [Paramecium tetraurelia]|uniref:ubiquitinyl hydrolase 1 n=1 Tax=Paramecium tetraurelia TaxID=5888 RepID=A0D2Z2_PARTE|nr:uncharacterized protein GSPATT00012894001 [Paramecium tetraurelia]CAK77409.1 unnamed protein product [Paramecium tetraurelia]|eukprot:XP_001444806.1 hypothetical protein (macronuclear) [Paramecium tetraurelia strain d4-2]
MQHHSDEVTKSKERNNFELENRDRKEIFRRLKQFFDKIIGFEIKYNFIQQRLNEIEEKFNKQLTKNESKLDIQSNDQIEESQQQNPIQKQQQQYNSLITEIEQRVNNQLKVIQESNLKELKQKEEQNNIWKDKIEIDIQNLLKSIKEEQNRELKESILQIKLKDEQNNSWKEKVEMDIQNLLKQIKENYQQKQCPSNDNNVTNQSNITQRQSSSNEQNGEIIKNTIEDIYSQTTRRRHVPGQYQPFIHQMQSQSDLAKYYNLKLEYKKTICQYMKGFRQVRGDGNCFYSSFGFGYLSLLIVHYDQNQYDEFLNSVIKKMRFRIYYQSTKIDDEKIETQFREEFIKRLNCIRNLENTEMRQDELFKQFSAYEKQEDQQADGYFYALSTIFFRNLSLHFIQQSEYKDNFTDKDTLLPWESECNSNEIVILILAQQLQINIVVFYFDKEQFKMMEYNKEAKRKIILLLKPGHYNLGVPNIENEDNI